MAQGDAVSGWASTATNGYLDVKPVGGADEWSIFALYGEAEVEIYHTDGTNSKLVIPAGAANTPTLLNNLGLVATNGKYWRIKNVNAGTKYLGYDGRQTK